MEPFVIKKKILLISSIKTHIPFNLNVAYLLGDRYECIFLLDSRSVWSETDKLRCSNYRGRKFEVISPPNHFFLTSLVKLVSTLKFSSLIFNFLIALRSYLDAKSILKEDYTFFISPIDTSYSIPYYTKVANKRGVKTIVLPFAIANHEGILMSLARKPTQTSFFRLILSNLIVQLRPKWKFHKTLGLKLAKNIWEICCMELFRVSPPNPWTIAGGNSTLIIVDSLFLKDYFVRSGADEKKIRLASLDAKIRPNPIQNKTTGDKINVLFSIPPDHVNCDVFNTHEEMVLSICESIISSKVNLTVSLHPRLNKDFYSKLLFEKFKLKISGDPIEDLIRETDLFVASTSATIRIALSLQKVVINFDIYSFRYSEYFNLPPVRHVYTFGEFKNEFNKLINEVDYRLKILDSFNNYKDYFSHKDTELAELLTELEKII
jgi:hypothetical protein